MRLDFGRSVWAAETHFLNCSLLGVLDSPDPVAAIRAEFAALIEDGDEITYVAESASNPRCLVVANVNRVVMLAGGVQGLGLAGRFRSDFAAIFGSVKLSIPPALQLEASQIYVSKIGSRTLQGTPLLTFIGHSAGAYVGDQTCVEFQFQAERGHTEQYDYGCPRSVTSSFAAAYTGRSRCRVFNFDDPIRLFPFSALESPFCAALMGPSVAIRWSYMKQRCIGFRSDADGSLIVDATDAGPLVVADLNFFGWLFSSDAFGSVGHSLATYRNRFRSAIPVQGPPTPPDTEGILVGQHDDDSPAQVRAQLARGTVNAGVALGRNEQALFALVNRSVPGQPTERFHRVRVPGGWLITYKGETVGMAHSLRVVKRTIRELNRGVVAL